VQAAPTSPSSSARPTGVLLLAVILGLAGLAAGTVLAVIVVGRRRHAAAGVLVTSATGIDRDLSVQSAASANVLGTAPLANAATAALSPVEEVDAPEQGPSLATSAASARDLSPLPEGALFQMVGHVRLARLPEPAEAATHDPVVPSFPDDGQSSPASAGSSAPLPVPGPAPVPEPALVAVPAGPPPLPDGSKELQVLGTQPRLVAEPGGVVELEPNDLELLTRLALEPGRTFGSDELRADIGSAKETDWAPNTLWTRVSALRQKIGADHLPRSKAGGYRAVGIGTDVARFEAAVARSKADPGGALGHLAEALSLVRGAPFAGVAAGTFGWATQGSGVATRLSNGILTVAVELATLAIGARNAPLAAWAITQGRLVSRDDELLEELELDAAAASPERSALARTWIHTKGRVRSDDCPYPWRRGASGE
jgi:hypothetical protein